MAEATGDFDNHGWCVGVRVVLPAPASRQAED
jgi:hypothetical protein